MAIHEIETTYADHPVVDEKGERIGEITDVVYDAASGEPTWAVVHPGPLRRNRYAPLDRSYLSEDGAVVLAHPKHVVMSAPAAHKDHVLTGEQERDLQQHYS